MVQSYMEIRSNNVDNRSVELQMLTHVDSYNEAYGTNMKIVGAEFKKIKPKHSTFGNGSKAYEVVWTHSLLMYLDE